MHCPAAHYVLNPPGGRAHHVDDRGGCALPHFGIRKPRDIVEFLRLVHRRRSPHLLPDVHGVFHSRVPRRPPRSPKIWDTGGLLDAHKVHPGLYLCCLWRRLANVAAAVLAHCAAISSDLFVLVFAGNAHCFATNSGVDANGGALEQLEDAPLPILDDGRVVSTAVHGGQLEGHGHDRLPHAMLWPVVRNFALVDRSL